MESYSDISEEATSRIGDGEVLVYGHGPLKFKTGPESLDILSREIWEANPELTEAPDLQAPASNVYFMNVKLEPCVCYKTCRLAVYKTQRYNMATQFQSDIRYNFLIGGDGTVYEGRGWLAQPSLPTVHKDRNVDSILIGYIGRYYRGRNLPKVMSDSAQRLVENGIKNNFVNNMFLYHDLMNYMQHVPRPILGSPRTNFGDVKYE